MPMLTPDQLTTIDRHLRKENWLINEELITELTDHYATGLEDRMAKGIALGVALREVHTGFGGRKGLIRMEETYRVSQLRTTYQLLMRAVADYFCMPKLPVTSLLAMGIYGLIRLAHTLSTTYLYGTTWVLVTWGIVQFFALGYVLFQLVKYSNRGAFSQKLGSTIIGGSLFHWVSSHISLGEWMYTYPIPASLLMTLFLIYEIAAVKLIFNHIREHGTPNIT